MLHFLARREIAELSDGSFQLRPTHRLFAHHAARTVAATDTKFHPSAGNQIEGCEQAGSHGEVASRGVRHASTQPHAIRIRGHQCQQWIRLLPQNV